MTAGKYIEYTITVNGRREQVAVVATPMVRLADLKPELCICLTLQPDRLMFWIWAYCIGHFGGSLE